MSKIRKTLKCSECNKNDVSSKKYPQGRCCCSRTMEDTDYIEGIVCKETDINDNEMKTFPLGEDGKKILLIKQKGKIHAIGTKCTHYGAPLDTGALGEGRVRCPWHGACFSIQTGDIEDYPGLDSLPCYQVNINEDGQVAVKAKRTDLTSNKRVKEMCKYDSNDSKTVVIVGGGPSGATCAESLRQEGFKGKIIMICKEKVLPYDRVKYSKAMDFNVEKAQLRPQMFYDEHRIETRLGIGAINLDTTNNTLSLDNEEKLNYTHLFICTGSKPRIPQTEGTELENIFTLRNYNDAAAIHSQLSLDKHVVVLGLGFIGMEVAAYCIGKCASVTVVGRDTVPLRSVFGETIGNRTRKEYESRGVKFLFQKDIKKFLPKEGTKIVDRVELADGNIHPADVVVIGIGSTFNTEWLKNSSIRLYEDGSIVVDEHLQTNVENVYAGGDIAYAPILGSDQTSAAIGHYSLAHYHGKIAALNICNKKTMLKTVPFFWTVLFGKSYRYSGYGKPSEVKIYGSLENYEFFAYHLQGDKVIAMSSVGSDPVVANFANLLYEGKTLTKKEIDENHIGWISNKPKELSKKFSSLVVEEENTSL